MERITGPDNNVKKKRYSTPSVKVLSPEAALSRLKQAALAGDAGAKEMLEVHGRIFGTRGFLAGHIDDIHAKLERAFQALQLSRTRKERKAILQKMLSLLEDADHIGLAKKARTERPASKGRPATHP